ncbi:MAG: helix-turn-helix domain-containing protein [Chitinivibrionales bacterium]|nr:helix-turn-helix domain-containing protein [Chitinivibrionales bacterium]
MAGSLKRSSQLVLREDLQVMHKLSILQQADTGKSITGICRQNHIDRKTFYLWKERYQAEGLAGLKRAASTHKDTTPPEVIEKVLGISDAHISWGCGKIANFLKQNGIEISSPTVQKILIRNNRASLEERKKRFQDSDVTGALSLLEPGEVNNEDSSTVRPLWQRIKSSIEKDVLNGNFAPGTKLSSIKALQSRYNISFPTIRRALAACEDDGLLQPSNRGWVVPRLYAGRKGKKIVLIGRCKKITDAKLEGIFNEELLFHLEAEAAQAGIGISILIHEEGSLSFYDFKTLQPAEMDDSEQVFGYIYLMHRFGEEQEQMLRRLSHLNKPLAILDEVGGWKYQTATSTHNLKVFSIATSSQPARTIARYLLELGHLKIAYFSPFHKHPWSKQRFVGLTEIYAKAGYDANVTLFSIDGHGANIDYYSDSMSRCDSTNLIDYYTQWKEQAPGIYTTILDPLFISEVPLACSNAEIIRQLEPHFEQALRDAEITAWVFANDSVAALARRYCKECSIDVPHRVSIVSFDNSLEALRNRLTSYSFNIQAYAHSMMDYLIRPNSTHWFGKTKPVMLEGIIVERDTTRKVDPTRR